MFHKIYNTIADTKAEDSTMITSYSEIFNTVINHSMVFIFSKKKKDEIEEEQEEYENSLICRFVLDGIGRKVGESVAVDEDLLIIKTRNKYLGVPLKHIEEEGKTLLVKGLIDRLNAEKMGEKWRQENFNVIKYDDEKDGL